MFTMSGIWPYPFFKLVPLPALPVVLFREFLHLSDALFRGEGVLLSEMERLVVHVMCMWYACDVHVV